MNSDGVFYLAGLVLILNCVSLVWRRRLKKGIRTLSMKEMKVWIRVFTFCRWSSVVGLGVCGYYVVYFVFLLFSS